MLESNRPPLGTLLIRRLGLHNPVLVFSSRDLTLNSGLSPHWPIRMNLDGWRSLIYKEKFQTLCTKTSLEDLMGNLSKGMSNY
ncbi:hypothetical protein JTE90_002469 [Oedothorax gibbosus]|uniref:Uncharacterized protein n=1 Tax=Oedothorax gibbosus TaxID=931172 RepID=A0AAV6UKU1_9ARAC|nr:hypothetical protein JTE90_002469 [Oedothorax gibbosus]